MKRDFLSLIIDIAVFPVRFTTLSIIPALIAGATALGSALFNYNSQKKTNNSNLDFQREQFEEQKMLNRNGYQMQVADMQKAGLNPATLNGNNLSAGSYSSNMSAPQVDLSPLASLAETIMSNKNQKDISKDSDKTSENIAKAQIDSNERIESARLAQEHEEFMLSYQNDVDRIANETNLTKAQVRKLISERAQVESSFNGSEIQNDTALRELFNYMRNGIKSGSSSSSVVGAVVDLAYSFFDRIDEAITGNDFKSFKAEYVKYLRSRRSEYDN